MLQRHAAVQRQQIGREREINGEKKNEIQLRKALLLPMTMEGDEKLLTNLHYQRCSYNGNANDGRRHPISLLR